MPWGDFLKKAASDLLRTPGEPGGQTWDQSVEEGLRGAADQSTRDALGMPGPEIGASEEERAYFRNLPGTGESIEVGGDVSARWLSGGVMDWIETDGGIGFTLFERTSGLSATLYATSDGQVLLDGDLAAGQLSATASPETLEYWEGRGFRLNGLVLTGGAYGGQTERRISVTGQLTTEHEGDPER